VLRASLLPIEELEATFVPPVEELIDSYGALFGRGVHARWEQGGREIAHAIPPSAPDEEEEEEEEEEMEKVEVEGEKGGEGTVDSMETSFVDAVESLVEGEGAEVPAATTEGMEE